MEGQGGARGACALAPDLSTARLVPEVHPTSAPSHFSTIPFQHHPTSAPASQRQRPRFQLPPVRDPTLQHRTPQNAKSITSQHGAPYGLPPREGLSFRHGRAPPRHRGHLHALHQRHPRQARQAGPALVAQGQAPGPAGAAEQRALPRVGAAAHPAGRVPGRGGGAAAAALPGGAAAAGRARAAAPPRPHAVLGDGARRRPPCEARARGARDEQPQRQLPPQVGPPRRPLLRLRGRPPRPRRRRPHPPRPRQAAARHLPAGPADHQRLAGPRRAPHHPRGVPRLRGQRARRRERPPRRHARRLGPPPHAQEGVRRPRGRGPGRPHRRGRRRRRRPPARRARRRLGRLPREPRRFPLREVRHRRPTRRGRGGARDAKAGRRHPCARRDSEITHPTVPSAL